MMEVPDPVCFVTSESSPGALGVLAASEGRRMKVEVRRTLALLLLCLAFTGRYSQHPQPPPALQLVELLFLHMLRVCCISHQEDQYFHHTFCGAEFLTTG